MWELNPKALRSLRYAREISQREMIRRTGIDRRSYVRMENGQHQNITLYTLSNLCVTLGCTPQDLLIWRV